MIFSIIKRHIAAILFTLAAAGIPGNLFSADENAEYFFSAGLLKSADEDFAGAIEAFEKSYKIRKQESSVESLVDVGDIKESLIEALMSKGKSDLSAKKNSDALQCFDKILVLSPENSAAKKLRSYILKSKKTVVSTKKRAPPSKVITKKISKEKPLKPKNIKKRTVKAKPPVTKKPPKKKIAKKTVKALPSPPKKVAPIPLPQKKPAVLPVKSAAKPIPPDKKISKINPWFSAGITLMLFITFFSYFKGRKKPRRIQEVLPQAKQEIPGTGEPLPAEKTATKIPLDSPPPAKQKITAAPAENYIPDRTTRVMLENPNAHVRARGVELITEELRGSSSEIIERMLAPCLSDSDSRVRANAAKALYEYNPELAMNTLRAMAHYSSKWMRLSAEWAFEKIGSPETIEHLLPLAYDTEKSIRSRAIKYLKKFYEEKKVPEHLMQKLKKVLDSAGSVV